MVAEEKCELHNCERRNARESEGRVRDTKKISGLRQVRDSAPPFRVLEKCQELCLRDRTATTNLVRTCTSFDFQPGNRIASYSGAAEYEESTCYLTREQAQPEGIGNLMLVPNSVHFTEVCLACEYPLARIEEKYRRNAR